MSDVVRVSANGKWAYLPVGSEAHQHLLRFAESGLADADAVEVRLHSDAGPMFWELLEDSEATTPAPLIPAMAMSEDGIALLSGEKLAFGNVENGSYNEYVDMSWLNNPSVKPGIPLSNTKMGDGDIVITAWPASGKLVPARAERKCREMVLELLEPQAPGDRCFVVDDSGGLVTASLKSTGGRSLKVMPQAALNSWLFSVGTKAVRQRSSRFSIADQGESFVITDNKNNRKLRGRYRTSHPESELESLEVMLGHGGLGSIIPHYELAGP